MSVHKEQTKTTVRTLGAKRRRGQPITMVTAYDFPSAQAVDRAGADAILVGDSVAMVVLGHETTLNVTMDEMLHHARAVKRGASRALLIGDLPFMSYQVEVAEAVRNAGRYLQEGGMDAVKLEGGTRVVPQARAIVDAGIPVMGHIGLTPQSVNAMGGWRVQGRSARAARGLVRDALALQKAGCFAIVLEGIPARLAGLITRRLSIPTIGIGAGSETSGQVLVYHDVLGLYEGRAPRFVKRYARLGARSRGALRTFLGEVERGDFPGEEHTYGMPEAAWQEVRLALEEEGPDDLRHGIRAVGRGGDA